MPGIEVGVTLVESRLEGVEQAKVLGLRGFAER
jgi:hypothetical protein